MNTKKHRLQFDITHESLQELDALKEQARAATRAEVVRNALRLYSWFLSQQAEGKHILVRKGDRTEKIEFLLF